MVRTLIYPSSGACDCAAELPHWSFCSVKTTQIRLPTTTKRQTTSHQTHITKYRKFTLTLNPASLQNKTTDVVIQSQAPDDGYINVRNVLST